MQETAPNIHPLMNGCRHAAAEGVQGQFGADGWQRLELAVDGVRQRQEIETACYCLLSSHTGRIELPEQADSVKAWYVPKGRRPSPTKRVRAGGTRRQPMTPLSKFDDKEPRRSFVVLVASFALPIIDVTAILLIRMITSSENRTAALVLYAFVFPIACTFVLFSLLASGRRSNGHLIAYVSIAGLTTLFNFLFCVFIRRWERTFETL
jgi:hypothetical protein